MADVRCPMCGKPNPPELEVCQYCQARLRPLIVTPPQDQVGPEKKAEAAGEDLAFPDWLSDLRQQDEAEEPEVDYDGEHLTPTPPEDLPDWLARMGMPEDQEAEQSRAKPQPDVESQTPAFGDLSEQTLPSSPPEKEEFPDWLAGLTSRDDSAESLPENALEEEAIQGGEEQDWMKRIHMRQQVEDSDGSQLPAPEQPEQAEVASAQPSGEVPDWLSGLAKPESTSKQEPEDFPEWLKSAEQVPPSATPAPAQAEPEWLSELSETAAAEASKPTLEQFNPSEEVGEASALSGVEPPAPVPQEVVPDWLAKIRKSEPVGSTPSEPETPGGQPEAAPAVEEPEPDWLSRLGVGAAQIASEGSVPAFAMDEKEAASLGLPSETGGEGVETPDLTALPDWLSQLKPEEIPSEAESPDETEPVPALAPAQLPSWLEAMRPVEAVAPVLAYRDETDERLETSGPLSGLRGVLPPESGAAPIRKPPVYSIRLQVSDVQQARINLLKEALASEGKPKPIPQPAIISPQNVFRIVIGLLLALVVLWTLWSGVEVMPLPDAGSAPVEILNIQKNIDTLPAGAAVLLSFDYEPALSGEMDAASGAVVQNLMSRNAYLALVSTSPTGPALAERSIADNSARLATVYTQYANLGYIPGGPTGLLSFASNPQQTMPFSLDEKYAWVSGTMAKVNTLADFSMVLVITDNPDTARAWVEQAQPVLKTNNTPLMMVTSAQAEPLVRPYYEAYPKQVSGLVSGLVGGATYESLTNRPGLARTYWDGFSASLLVAAGLILIGGLFNAVSAAVAGSKEDKGEG